jgi:hypothetical protein
MPLVVKDRVRETSTSTGTGDIILNGAVVGFQSFAAIGDGNTTYYAIVDAGSGSWEVGIGTYTSSGTTLSRDTILESSNAGAAVNFAANVKDVFVTYPADIGVVLFSDNADAENGRIDFRTNYAEIKQARNAPLILSTNRQTGIDASASNSRSGRRQDHTSGFEFAYTTRSMSTET